MSTGAAKETKTSLSTLESVSVRTSGYYPIFAMGMHTSAGDFLVFIGTIGVAAGALLASILAGAVYIHYLVLRDIYVDPSFSRTASLWVIGFVFLCDFFQYWLASWVGVR